MYQMRDTGAIRPARFDLGWTRDAFVTGAYATGAGVWTTLKAGGATGGGMNGMATGTLGRHNRQPSRRPRRARPRIPSGTAIGMAMAAALAVL